MNKIVISVLIIVLLEGTFAYKIKRDQNRAINLRMQDSYDSPSYRTNIKEYSLNAYDPKGLNDREFIDLNYRYDEKYDTSKYPKYKYKYNPVADVGYNTIKNSENAMYDPEGNNENDSEYQEYERSKIEYSSKFPANYYKSSEYNNKYKASYNDRNTYDSSLNKYSKQYDSESYSKPTYNDNKYRKKSSYRKSNKNSYRKDRYSSNNYRRNGMKSYNERTYRN